MENYLSTVDDVRSMVEKSILRVESLASCMALPSVSARTLVNNVTRRETMATTRFMADGKRQIDFVLVHEADRSRRSQSRSDLKYQAENGQTTAENSQNHTNNYHNKMSLSIDQLSANNQNNKQQDDEYRRFFAQNLETFGLNVETEICLDNNDYFGKTNTENPKRALIFTKIHAPWKILASGAEALRIKMPLKLKDKRIFRCAGAGTSSSSAAWHFGRKLKQSFKKLSNFGASDRTSDAMDVQENGSIGEEATASRAYRIHAPFTLEDQQKFDISDRDAFFEDRHRIEIVWEILQKVPCDPNDVRKRGIEFLLAQKIYDAAYPLHDGDAPFVRRKGDEADAAGDHLTRRQFLKDKWADWKAFCRDQPLNQVGHIFYAKMTSETHKASKRLMKYLRKTDEPGLFFVKIRDYFGEKVAFYFLFMDFYTKMLAWPAIFGLLTFFYGLIYTDYYSEDMRHVCDANSTPGKYLMCPICQPPDCDPWSMAEDGCLKYKWEYRIDNFGSFMHTCLTTLWSIIFFKTWKRRESRVSVLWDTYDAEEHDHSIRPAYEQRAVYERQNPITGETEKYIPSHYKTFWMTFSVMVTLAMLVIDSVSLMVLVMSRIALYGLLKRSSFHSHIATYNVEYARWIVHGLILIMILIFERVFSFVAHILTDYECPKTQKRYTTSLLWKLFIFELLNDFIPLGYAAWMKQTWVRTPRDLNFLSELCDGGCLSEVAELITILLLARLTIGNVLEICVPYIKNFYNRRFHPVLDESERKLPRWLKDYKLNKVQLDGVYGEYMEMMVQFSFVVMFVPASPVAALVCFLNNIVEIRIDSMKLLVTKRRPVPIRVPGVQIWNRFMDILVKVGIVCNAALLAFTSEIVPRFYYDYLYPMRNNFTGYTHFSLSEISTEGWLNLSASVSSGFEAKGYNGSECYYQDNRHREPPYSLRTEFWEISTARVSMFAIYSCLFFILMWLVNLLVDDVPADVKDRIKRNKYLMATVSGHCRRNTVTTLNNDKNNNSRKGSRSLAPNLHKNYQDLMRKVPNIINDLNNDDYAVAGGNSSPDDNTSAGLANGAAVDDEPPAGDVDFGATAPTMTAAPFPTITVENLRRATAKQQENGSALTNGSYKRRKHLLPPIESTITTPV